MPRPCLMAESIVVRLKYLRYSSAATRCIAFLTLSPICKSYLLSYLSKLGIIHDSLSYESTVSNKPINRTSIFTRIPIDRKRASSKSASLFSVYALGDLPIMLTKSLASAAPRLNPNKSRRNTTPCLASSPLVNIAAFAVTSLHALSNFANIPVSLIP